MAEAAAIAVKERPILFSGPMVKAILEGRKTQTRRVIKGLNVTGPNPPNNFFDFHKGKKWVGAVGAQYPGAPVTHSLKSPYGVPGDRLWVRETFMPDPPINGWPGDIEWNGCDRPISGVPEQYRTPFDVIFKETWTGDDLKWKPAIHMPRWASRIKLEIVKVRVERLQDITREDVRAEGIPETWGNGAIGLRFPGLQPHEWDNMRWDEQWKKCWDSINAERGFDWAQNPWVWVLDFKRV